MSKKEIEKLLSRGVTNLEVKKDLEQKLSRGKPLRVKLGIDPTGSDLHLGHGVVLRKLRQFQDRGHQIIFLFGGFTATIGDPSGKNQARPPLSLEQVQKNSRDYLAQAAKIIDIDKVEIRNNREWLEKLSSSELMKLVAQKSVQQILARRDFQERIRSKTDILLQELLYPLLQGYDSVALGCDIEIGGNDQLFNLLVGRDLQKKYRSKNVQDILTMELIEGTDGVQKMSKSLNNYISLSEVPEVIFGKLMSIPDSLMMKCFECLTDIDLKQAKKMIAATPRDAKIFLAKNIITWLYDSTQADRAQQDFYTKFVVKEIPKKIREIKLAIGSMGILDLITKVAKFAPSNSEARRIIMSRGVKFDGEIVDDPKFFAKISTSHVLQVGKKKFVRIVSKK